VITEFTRRLEHARKVLHHHSHPQAAAALGIVKSQYGKWERGENRPQPRHYPTLAAYMEEEEGEIERLVADAVARSRKAARPTPATSAARWSDIERELAEIKARMEIMREAIQALIARTGEQGPSLQ